jgi:hypothetical protein
MMANKTAIFAKRLCTLMKVWLRGVNRRRLEFFVLHHWPFSPAQEQPVVAQQQLERNRQLIDTSLLSQREEFSLNIAPE